jgi:hypothetical protein
VVGWTSGSTSTTSDMAFSSTIVIDASTFSVFTAGNAQLGQVVLFDLVTS